MQAYESLNHCTTSFQGPAFCTQGAGEEDREIHYSFEKIMQQYKCIRDCIMTAIVTKTRS